MIYLITYLSVVLYLLFIVFIISGLFKHKSPKISLSKDLPLVSVVIAARNEEKNLPDLIYDLVNQEYPLDKLEVIFVNDRSTDLTNRLLNEASDNYSFINHIVIEELSHKMTPKKYALTKGIESAKGEIIISTDADCRVGKLWVSSMTYDVIRCGGISIGFSTISDTSFFDQYQKIDFLGIIAANAGAGGWKQFWSGTGQNLAYFKNDFLSIDGFEPVKNKISGDDMYLVQSISKIKTGSINIDPNSFVKTEPMTNIKEFINQRTRWASNAKLNIKKSPYFFSFLATSLSFNIIILFYFLFSDSWHFLFLFKFVCDGLVLLMGSMLFNTNIKFPAYFLWATIQPIYIPIIGLLGIREKFTWKQ